eukprot:TRINITY_DN2679_c0_g5_i1.p1 TRINITY_DN2679_c0_g5~~TRINITY_DN2679_c0_g5_i1.p1  ORF type:complete len:128 (+),score=2.08 TRINITY_DN2679_c0_g5_i1:159-542(+)
MWGLRRARLHYPNPNPNPNPNPKYEHEFAGYHASLNPAVCKATAQRCGSRRALLRPYSDWSPPSRDSSSATEQRDTAAGQASAFKTNEQETLCCSNHWCDESDNEVWHRVPQQYASAHNTSSKHTLV